MNASGALRRCVTPDGFGLSAEPDGDSRRIGGRNAVVCSLAAITSGEADLINTARASLETLAGRQGPAGQIPSHITSEGEPSYERVDATSWWVLGACVYGRCVDDTWLADQRDAIAACERILRSWEYDDGGLIYAPACEQTNLAGYLLYEQAVRLWASRELHAACRRHGWQIPLRRGPTFLAERIGNAFASDGDFIAGVHAGTPRRVFDVLGAALCTWLEVGPSRVRERAFLRADAITRHGLLPRLTPTHAGTSSPPDGWARDLSPIVTAFWAMAAARRGAALARTRWAEGVAAGNRDHHFPSSLKPDGRPSESTGCSYSAAAEVLAISGENALWS